MVPTLPTYNSFIDLTKHSISRRNGSCQSWRELAHKMDNISLNHIALQSAGQLAEQYVGPSLELGDRPSLLLLANDPHN